jgi:hypothetical protein
MNQIKDLAGENDEEKAQVVTEESKEDPNS